ncbi:MAG: hypothetical protein U1F68_14975 [Gammaproteobacteria bacterium]
MMPLPTAFANPEARAIAEQGAHLAVRERSLSGLTARYPTKPTWAGDERVTSEDVLPQGWQKPVSLWGDLPLQKAAVLYEVHQRVGDQWTVRAIVESRALAEPHAENAKAEGFIAQIVQVEVSA